MHNSALQLLNKLNNERKKYAKATIVRRQVPCSSKPGDFAIIMEDGKMQGWVGGGCTHGIVLKEALLSMQEGRARLVRISPTVVKDNMPNTKYYNMTCQSGGSVDVFIEPVLPRPQLIIVGHSHIAMALAKIGLAMDYLVTAIHASRDATVYGNLEGLKIASGLNEANITANTYIVVCTQGSGDEQALESAILTQNDYIAFVSSRRKANAIFNSLRSKKISIDALKKIKTPAGIDINAKLPEEVAISILAQIIEDIRKPLEESSDTQKAAISEDYYLNPVCNIPIQKSTAKHVLEYKGDSVYFCCDGCKIKFEAEPEKYMESV